MPSPPIPVVMETDCGCPKSAGSFSENKKTEITKEEKGMLLSFKLLLHCCTDE